MRLKYIAYEIETPGAHGIKRRIPIFFPEPLVHALMHEAVEDVLPGRAELVSAGFVDTDGGMHPYGESESLKQMKLPCVPLKDDYKVFAMYDHMHGIL